MNKILSFLIFSALIFQGCSRKGPAGIFAKRTLSEKYADKLIETGLNNSSLGRQWLGVSASSLSSLQPIKLPYQETGYFNAEKPAAHAYLFSARRGEKITVRLTKIPAVNFMIYLDVWESNNNQAGKLVTYLDTNTTSLNFEVDRDLSYIIRVQPELLSGGEYMLTITNGPSLGFPVQGKSRVQSFWGDGRDNNSRKHEGVDIFASRGTPALAAAPGFVTRVGTNSLGGNVIFMRPEGKDFSLYYAHLDKQLVREGQQVLIGDTLGLVGNTGNAITTTPHLHFGIYTFSGAIDPLTFINPATAKPAEIRGNKSYLGQPARSLQAVKVYADAARTSLITSLPKNTMLNVHSANADVFRITLPDQQTGFIDARQVTKPERISTIKAAKETPVFDRPDLLAARKTLVNPGEFLVILGSFGNFNFVNAGSVTGWVSK